MQQVRFITKRIILAFLLIYISDQFIFSQNFGSSMYFTNQKKKKILIPFKLVNNLIVIPLKINNSNTLQFILDSGVKTPIVTEISASDSVNMELLETQFIHGLGEGQPLEVFVTMNNDFSIKDEIHSSLTAYLLQNNIFHLSSKMGTRINGIIGYDIFGSFIVDINYANKQIILHNPNYYNTKQRKRTEIFPLIIQDRKSYFNAIISTSKADNIPVKLLIDTGSSLPIWISEKSDDRIEIPDKNIEAFLGQGLNGNIYGKQGKIKSLKIGRFAFKNPIVSFPDSNSVMATIREDGRNGSLGSEVLRRFNVIIDYHNKQISFTPNHTFKDAFTYDMSGLEVLVPIPDYPVFIISKVNSASPAGKAGVKTGDQILFLNGLQNKSLTLNKIKTIFQEKPGRKIKMTVLREEKQETFTFYLINEL